MKYRPTYHRNGEISFRLIPETPEERTKLYQTFARPPGGLQIEDNHRCRIDTPILTKDGLEWPDDHGVGDVRHRDGLFTRRVHLGYEEDGRKP
jgi:hypothetical protein